MHLPRASEYMGKNNKLPQDKPKEGTILRDLYDRFYDNQGKLIPIISSFWPPGYFVQLQDYYGLDIRCIRKGSKLRGAGLYYLCGYWNGKDYTDLTHLLDKAERL